MMIKLVPETSISGTSFLLSKSQVYCSNTSVCSK
ncbi:Uncharacterised protein [uncultured Clostridium sp.]|mgnify:CR=1 FL=1|nr:Uncharacterised protein [uncultured Clostridium sp.]